MICMFPHLCSEPPLLALPLSRSSQASAAGLPSSVKVDAYKEAKPGVWDWWASYSLQLNLEREPEAVCCGSGGGAAAGGKPAAGACTAGSAAAADENSPRQAGSSSFGDSNGKGNAGARQAAVKGRRYRLLPPAEGQQRALPAVGKLSGLFGRHTCEAQLSLPASATR